jgi:hypothetical protein
MAENSDTIKAPNDGRSWTPVGNHTASDSTPVPRGFNAIQNIGTAGDVVVTNTEGASTTLYLLQGQVIQVSNVVLIKATGTDAGGTFALLA